MAIEFLARVPQQNSWNANVWRRDPLAGHGLRTWLTLNAALVVFLLALPTSVMPKDPAVKGEARDSKKDVLPASSARVAANVRRSAVKSGRTGAVGKGGSDATSSTSAKLSTKTSAAVPPLAKSRAKMTPRRPITGSSGTAAAMNSDSLRAERCRQQIDAALQPARLLKLIEECEKDIAAGPFLDEIRHLAVGARSALEGQRLAGLSSDFFDEPGGDGQFRGLIAKAVRGDQLAAYSLARAFRNGESGVASSPRRVEQWLRFASELGNGRASWELAELYNYSGQIADAARFEKKALSQGYRPGVRLPSRGY